MAEVPTLVFPRPSHTSTLNDNYCVGSKTLHVDLIRSDPVFFKTQLSNRKTLKLDVSYPVVFHAPSVHSRGPPQKKGVRPAPCQNKIKHVKGVCCVNPCLSAPSVPMPQCCLRTDCRGKITKFLASLANHGFESSGSLYPQGGLHSSLQTKALFDKVPLDSKLLLKSNQEHVPKRSPYKSHEQVGSRKGGCQVVPGLLQPSFSGSQTKQKMETDLRPESSQFIPQHRHFQNGNSRDNLVVLENRGVDHIAGLQRRILPHSHCPKVKKVSQVLPVQSNLSVHSSSLRVGHSSRRVHQGGQGNETHGSSTGYQNPPVPR